jgi:hypothetical protein
VDHHHAKCERAQSKRRVAICDFDEKSRAAYVLLHETGVPPSSD